jgi:hypothetical protein
MSVDNSQDCCGTANGPQVCYVPPQWLVLPCHHMAENKTSHHNMVDSIHVQIFWGVGVLSPYMTYVHFLQLDCNKAEVIQKRGHNLALTWRNVHGKIWSLSRTPFFDSLERWRLEYPIAMCCKQVDHIFVRKCEEGHSILLLAFAHTCEYWVCWNYLSVQNLKMMM